MASVMSPEPIGIEASPSSMPGGIDRNVGHLRAEFDQRDPQFAFFRAHRHE